MAHLHIDTGPPEPLGRLRKPISCLGCLGRAGLYLALVPVVVFAFICLPHCGEPEPLPTEQAGPIVAPTVKPTISPRMQEAIDAAETMEAQMRQAAPQMRPILSMVDVATGDNHLIVHFKPEYAQLTAAEHAIVEGAVAKLWRGTKWVRERGWSGDVEFIEYRALDDLRHDGTDSWSHIDRAH